MSNIRIVALDLDGTLLNHKNEVSPATRQAIAEAVEQGVVERIRQRAARPTENGIRSGGAATVRPDVAGMTRAQREALERRVLHGAQIVL